MVYGVGIDLIKIERLKKVIEKWEDRFLKRVFTQGEIAYCYEKKEPYLSLAVRFAAKEALIKAMSSAVPVSFTDIEVINIATGKPVLKVHGRLEDFFREKFIKKAHLSLSHEHEYGIACVILEQEEK